MTRLSASSLRKQVSATLLETDVAVLPQLVDGEPFVAVSVQRRELARNDAIRLHAEGKGQLAGRGAKGLPNRRTRSLRGDTTRDRNCCG